MTQEEQGQSPDAHSYKAIFDAVTDGIIFHDLDGRVYDANQAACEMHGYSRQELLALHPTEFIHPNTHSEFLRFREECARSGTFRTVGQDLHKDGSIIDVEVRGRKIHYQGAVRFVALLRDITEERKAERERVRLEDELHRTRRLEAIGRLAGGIAHDFNNLLTVIQGASQILLMDSPQDSVREAAEHIEAASLQASELTRKLLSFAKRQVTQPVPVQPRRQLLEVAQLLQRLVTPGIRLRTSLGESNWHVKIEPGQLEQVITNLVINARDAMPSGGTIEITLAEKTVDSAEHVLSPGEYLQLSVSDTGVGMEREVVQQAFEPFFTTKQTGTGFGLATSHGVVTEAGGHIEIDSAPGEGTVVSILLPRTNEEPPKDVANGGSTSGTETILLVDDVAGIRDVVGDQLKKLGYHVLIAKDGKEAMLIAREHKGTIDLLFTDIVMPEMDGWQTASSVHGERPGIEVLYTSGFATSYVTSPGTFESDCHFLPKPYTPEEAARYIRRLLDL